MNNEMQPYSEQGFSSEIVEQLQAPLDVSNIKFRSGGGGRQLKYIKGDTAIDAANRIFGFGQWGYKVVARSHETIQDEKKGVIDYYTADVELYVVGAAFPFPGDGVGIVTAPYTVEMHEKARKEAATDALKRALRHYGDQFGLSLYSEDDYVDAGNGELIKVSEVKPGQGKAPAPNRVIDSKPAANALPPASQQSQPKPQATSKVSAPLAKDLRKRCDSLFGPGKWDIVLTRVLKAVVPDDNLTPEDCNALNNAFDNAERNRQQKAS